MSKFKVGDKVRNVAPEDWQAKDYSATPGEVLEVRRAGLGQVSLYSLDGKYRYDSEDSHIKLAVSTLDDLQVDDVIVSDVGDAYTVLAVIGNVVGLSDAHGDGHFQDWYTVKELKDNDWTVKGAEEEVTEVTMDDIAEKLGVPVEKLRIKKEAE